MNENKFNYYSSFIPEQCKLEFVYLKKKKKNLEFFDISYLNRLMIRDISKVVIKKEIQAGKYLIGRFRSILRLIFICIYSDTLSLY